MILRNSPSAVSGFRNFIFIALRGRSHVRQSTTALLFTAAVNFTVFLAAGILSSKVTVTRSDVLLSPTNCGRWWAFDTAGRQGMNAFEPSYINDYYRAYAALRNLRHTSSSFATTCYVENPPNDCTSFGRGPPTWTKSLSPGCPFGDGLCAGNLSLRLDSGYLDSALILGINTPPEDRLSLRMTKECAPLLQDEYLKTYDAKNVSEVYPELITGSKEWPIGWLGTGWEDYSYEALFYGPTLLYGYTNATFLWNNSTITQLLHGVGTDILTPPMILYEDSYYPCQSGPHNRNISCSSFKGSSNSYQPGDSFDPLPGLRVDDQNTVLVYLAMEADAYKPVNDPWFRTDEAFERDGLKLYSRSHFTSALACSEKTLICKPSDHEPPACVQLNPYGWPLVSPEGSPVNITHTLGLSQRQTAVARRLQDASWAGDFMSTVADLGAQSLLANQHFVAGNIASLPDDQWAREIEHWFATQLITMQTYTTEFITGWQDRTLDEFITPPEEADQWMCDSQVVQSKDYASFSVLGIGIILGIGGLLVLLNACIAWLVDHLRAPTGLQLYKKESWKASDLLELQSAKAGPIYSQASSLGLGETVSKETITCSSRVSMQAKRP